MAHIARSANGGTMNTQTRRRFLKGTAAMAAAGLTPH